MNVIHYLDDFFFWSKESSPNCARALSTAVPLCHRLCLPVAPQKVATMIVFLGIVIDSARQEIRLTEETLVRLHQELWAWGDRRSASKRQLQYLIGLLNHVAKVVMPGRLFLRSLIDTMKIPCRQDQKVHLNLECRGDIVWWQEFLVAWNGVGFFPGGPLVYSDALGSWGCRAFTRGSAEWLQLLVPASWLEIHIAAKELVPIVASLAVWGPVAQCKSTVIIWQGSARDPLLNHLRVLALLLVRGSKYSSMRTTSRGSGTVEPMRSREIAPCYFSPSSHRPRVIPQSYRSLSQPFYSTGKAPGHPLSRVCTPAHEACMALARGGTCGSAPGRT